MDLLTRNGYIWPSKYPKPFDHQRVTAEHFVTNKRSFCFNDIGTSKTLSALWAADFLMSKGAIKKVLISSPLSTLWTVWQDEIFFNIYGRRSAVLHGSKKKRLEQLALDVDFYIINHEGVQVIWDELSARDDISLVIVDEGAKLKNARTDKWRAHNLLAGPESKKGLWWMTGSPMPRSPEDVWAQGKIMNQELVPRYFTRFRDLMMVKINMYKYVPVKGWQDKCFAMLQPAIRYTRDECLDLPPCTTQIRQVEMSKEQAKAYKDMLDSCRAELKKGPITAVNEAAKRIKMMQLAAGAVYDGDEFVHSIDCTRKLCALKESVEEAGNKAIVFVSFRHSIDLLKKFLEGLGLTVGIVHGGVGTTKRREVFKNFQHGDLQIILAHPGTMSHGLTLTAAHTIIWWAPVDSYETYEQACGRIVRPGQISKQTIIHLICSDIEAKIYKRLQSKAGMQGLLLSLFEEK